MTKVVVAIDGPAGSGKSSVSKAVAAELGYSYLDTGAAYRALTWASQNLEGFSLEALESANLAEIFDYQIGIDPSNYFVKVGAQDVTLAIRSGEVAEGVSAVARIANVRKYMKALTRQIARDTSAAGIVIEGRDITTVVAPGAKIKILLTASEEVRLNRRSAELSNAQRADLKRQVIERDASDSKVVDFMTPAPGVLLVDTSDLNFEQTVQTVVSVIESGIANKESND
jgi:cytidylate kinase